MQTLREYFKIALPLLFAFFVYRWTIVPLVEIPRSTAIRQWETIQPAHDTPWWHNYFAEGSWQRTKSTKMAHTSNGIILFQTMKQAAPDRWEFTPLTIILQQDSEPNSSGKGSSKRPIFIENPDGAEVLFTEKVDWTSKLPALKWGHFRGPIRIASPPLDSKEGQGFVIDTRDVFINGKQISTTDEIKMTLGYHHIEGRNLTIHLNQDLLSRAPSPSEEESSFHDLDRLELFYVDRVELQLPNGGLWAGRQNKSAADSNRVVPAIPKESIAAAKLKIDCKGSFQFDFHTMNATLQKGVSVYHIVEGAPMDQFQSHLLKLHFQWTPDGPIGQARDNSNVGRNGQWGVDGVEASGNATPDVNDPYHWVRLDAPGIQSQGQGRSMELDLTKGGILFRNRPSINSPAESAPVYLRNDKIQVWSPEIHYQGDRASLVRRNPVALADQHLGLLSAAGPGWAQMQADDGSPWKLTWGKTLTVKPDGNEDLISIDGSANVGSASLGRFASERLDLWIESVSAEQAAQSHARSPSSTPPDFILKRLQARGVTEIQSSDLNAYVKNSLNLWFIHPSLMPTASASIRPNLNPLQSSANLKLAQFVQVGKPETKPEKVSKLNHGLGNLFLVSSGATLDPGARPRPPNDANTPSLPGSGGGARPIANNRSPSMNSIQAGSTNPTRAVRPPAIPLDVRGDLLNAQLILLQETTMIDSLWVQGNVTVKRPPEIGGLEMPLTIVGDLLKLSAAHQGEAVGTVRGKTDATGATETLAKIILGNGWIEGPEINFNQLEQRIWMDYPGTIVLPPELLSTLSISSIESNANSNPIAWIEPPRVYWKERMSFNGQLAKMIGGVTLSGRMFSDPSTILHFEGNANDMEVLMSQPVSMDGKQATPSKVHTVRLFNQVDIRTSQTDQSGKVLKSRERIAVPRLDYFALENRILGYGPGAIWSNHPENSEVVPGMGNSHGRLAATDSRPNISSSLQCMNLRFNKNLEGFLNQKEIRFFENVEALIGPVQNWDQLLDVASLRQLGIDQKTIYCEMLRVYSTQDLSWNRMPVAQDDPNPPRGTGAPNSTPAAWELQAKGNVEMESVSESSHLKVKAEMAEYDTIKNLVTIEGTARMPATLSSVTRGNTTSHWDIELAKFNPKTGEIPILKIRSASSEFQSNPRGSSNIMTPKSNPEKGKPLVNPRNGVRGFQQPR